MLIWNHTSGEITLERLECTPTLKQKRTGNWPPPASTYAVAPDCTQPAKAKGKAKAKKSSSSAKPTLVPLQGDSAPHSSVPAATNSVKHGLSGFVAGPNLASVPNSSTDAGVDKEKRDVSDSDSDSSSSDYSSSTDCSDTSEDTPTHKTDLAPLHDHPQLQFKNNIHLSESGSDSN